MKDLFRKKTEEERRMDAARAAVKKQEKENKKLYASAQQTNATNGVPAHSQGILGGSSGASLGGGLITMVGSQSRHLVSTITSSTGGWQIGVNPNPMYSRNIVGATASVVEREQYDTYCDDSILPRPMVRVWVSKQEHLWLDTLGSGRATLTDYGVRAYYSKGTAPEWMMNKIQRLVILPVIDFGTRELDDMVVPGVGLHVGDCVFWVEVES
jgi:hypothetical protein